MSGAYGSSHWLYDAEVFQTGQSLKFSDADNQFLKRTPSTSNQKTWTWSAWIKRTNLGSGQGIFGTDTSSTANFFLVQWTSSDTIFIQGYASSSQTIRLGTTRVFRDPSAWYHIVVAVDTTQATASNRLKLYINGVQETDFSSGNAIYPNSQNLDTLMNNSSYPLLLGAYDVSGTPDTLNGYLFDIHFIDGQALDPTSFIKTENNQLQPKEYFGSYGTNGFRLNFQDDVISEGFNAATYRGTGQQNSVSGIGFSPAFVWIKDRTDATVHYLSDVCRGADKEVYSNGTYTEYTDTQTLKSFDSDGFTVGTSTGVNGSADDVVAWCWEGGGAPTADNSAAANAEPTAGSVKIDGSNKSGAFSGSPTIAVTRLTANTAKGFSVVTYTGSSNTSFPHGLSSAPKWVLIKNRGSANNWGIYHTGLSSTSHYLFFSNAAEGNYGSPFIAPESNTVTIDASSSLLNSNGANYVAYCWAEVSGYSKFGSFTGNGGSQAIDVGFEPAVVLLKRTNSSSWAIFDNTRQPANTGLQYLSPSNTGTETTNANMVFSGNTFNDNGYVSDNGTTVLFMAFADTREAAFFRDVSGNNNNFTPNNLEYRDSMIDTPLTNFAVGNPLTSTSNNTFSEGNLKVTGNGVNYYNYASSIAMQSGNKYYFEVYSNRRDSSYWAVGICETDSFAHGMSVYNTAGSMALQQGASVYYLNSAVGSTTNRYNSTAYLFSFAIDLDNNIFHFRADGGTWENSGDPAGGSGGYAIPAAMQGKTLLPWFGPNGGNFQILNLGQDSSFSGIKIPQGNGADGEDFFYTPPTGFKSLQLSNLPTSAIADPTTQFNTVLYTGTGSTRSVTGVGFGSAPDFVWIKQRNAAENHFLTDSVRGAGLHLRSDQTTAESDTSATFTSFDADGFSLTGSGSAVPQVNDNNDTYVAWNWLAGGTSPSQTYVVKVVSDGGNKYRFDDFGTSAITLNLQEGGTYTFDQSDSSNSGHPFRFSTTSNGTHGGGSEYTVGVTTNGTAGSAGAYTRITVAASAPTLYYYCTVHSGMGGQANTNSTFGSTNVKGTIQAVVSANSTAGFSIIKYTGNGSNSTIGHGLSSPVEALIIKERNATSQWVVGHHNLDASAPFDKGLYLDDTRAVYDDATNFNDTAPTSTVFSVGTGGYVNDSSNTYICYAFHSVEGYCKVGTYVGNNSSDGAFVHTGFRVAFLLTKAYSTGGTHYDWAMYDNARSPTNAIGAVLEANQSQAEVTGTGRGLPIDFLSNGIKFRSSYAESNAAQSYIYIAFAESPFKTASAR